ncbi:unnamed protein product [Mytilus coruscus]|uniref:Uncharacterized protein n=1 Tax=Mytilus coruscus TaxID=42192 RepID=A0A6J8CKY6_MYTCO|nr:unnamed protein product [Mytilus coruscus]
MILKFYGLKTRLLHHNVEFICSWSKVIHTMEKNEITQFEGFEIDSLEKFPFSGIKVIGAIHVGLSVTCMILGVINVVTFVVMDESPTFTDKALKEKQELAMQITISSTPMWCGIWFCMCGTMALNISRQKKSSIYCFKMSFLILSILCSALFGPACACVNAYEALLRHGLYSTDYKWLVPLLIAFFAFNEIVVSIISAIACCCCATLKETKVRVLLTPNNQTQHKLMKQDFQTRPGNPHLQRDYIQDNRDIFRISNRNQHRNISEQPMFKTHSKNITTQRSNFTADHIRYNNIPD